MVSDSFSQRSLQPELMDTEKVSFEVFEDCLCDLETINRWTRAYAPTLSWLQPLWKKLPPGIRLSIWDIGSGGGDMLRQIQQVKPPHIMLDMVGIDMNPWSKRFADNRLNNDESIRFETANIFDLTPDRTADFIISSLFTHHLTDAELIRFIRWMEQHSRRGWFINDLHRHPIPYYFIQQAVRAFRLNRLVQHDAPVSVLRGFTRQDWQKLLLKAEVPLDSIQIQWHWPFRYGIARNRYGI